MRRGFTLVELLIVIIIIAVLAAIAIPKFQDGAEKAEHAKAKADLALLRQAVSRVHFDTNHYPTELSALDKSTKPAKGKRHNGNNWLEPAMPNSWQGPYLHETPACPIDGYRYAMRWTPAGVLKIRISTSGDADNDNNEPGNPYFNW